MSRDPSPPSPSFSPRGTSAKPVLYRVDAELPDASAIDLAGSVLRHGGLVAFPTETVYGLGANALSDRAVRGIYEAKGRPSFNPLIVHVLDLAAAMELSREVPDVARALAAAFWPGPLTLVLRRRPVVPDVVTAGLDTVGVRAPSHPVARALIAAARVPVAAPSANRYTRVSPTTAEHVVRQLGRSVDIVLDAGATEVGIESTVLDVSGPRPVILRPGSVTRAAIESVVGAIDVSAGAPARGSTPRPSPGMDERHYAPSARLIPFDGADARGAARQLQSLRAAGGRVGLVLRTVRGLRGDCTLLLPPDPAGYARALYAALHELDEARCAVALVERVPDDGEWAGVADRLRRAGVQAAGAETRVEEGTRGG